MSNENEPIDFAEALKLERRAVKEGPSLRDLFAMSALQGLLSSDRFGFDRQTMVDIAYRYADIMLIVRNSKKS